MNSLKYVFILFAAAFFVAAVPATQPGANADRWRSLIPRLGDADFARREEAQKELDKATPRDLPALREVLKGASDEEVKARIQARIAAIEEEVALNPPPVSLEVTNAPYPEVLSELNKQMGGKVKTWPEQDFDRDMRFTLSAREKPFLEIISQLSRQHAITCMDINGEARWMLQQPGVKIAVVKGPVAIVPDAITRARQFNLQEMPAGQLPGEAYSLNCRMVLDPRLNVEKFAQPEFTEIVDDRGNVLLKSEQNMGWNLSGQHIAHFGASMPVPDKRGTKIASAKGVTRFMVITGSERLEIADASAKVGQSFELGGQKVKVSRFDVRAEDIRFSLEAVETIPDRGGAPARLVSVSFIDADGKILWNSTMRGGVGGTIGWPAIRTPVKIVLTIPTKTKELVVPFELKDIVLP